MFTPAGSPFLSEVPHFYTDLSFQPPPVLAPPVPPDDWVSFHPLDAEGPASFDAFRASPTFRLAMQQFLDRIADCNAFARRHFQDPDTTVILDLFKGFGERLTAGDGEPHFGDALAQLYSRGKLHFDRFCLRLAQDDLDLHHRKQVLRELAFQLHACRAQGPAFEEAACRLDRKPGGLQGEFHELLLMRTEALLREVINRPQPGVPPSSAEAQRRLLRIQSMEVHMVNRLRLELGLPGGDPHDRFVAADSLVTPQQILDCRRLLLQELRPVTLARDLAEQYVATLRSSLPAALQAPDADLSDHTPEVDRAQQRMEATFGKVPLDHLLDYDADTDRTGWLNDVSLVASDLLGQLERQGLIVPQPRGSLLREPGPNGYWELMQVDWRLFLTEESTRLEGPRQQVPVQLRQALTWLSHMPLMGPLPPLVDAVIASNPRQDLLNIPTSWLMDDERCAAFCRRLGEHHLLGWLQQRPYLGAPLRGRLLRMLTDLAMPDALTAVMAPQLRYDAADCVRLAGGGDILVRAMNRRDPDISVRWFAKCREALPLMEAEEALGLFRVGTLGLVGLSLRQGHSGHVRSVLGLLGLAADLLKIAPPQLPALLHAPEQATVQALMAAGRTRRLTALGEGLQMLAERGHLKHLPLCQALAGPDWHRGCSGALRGGHANVVRWFHAQVQTLLAEGGLNRAEAARLIMSDPAGEPSAGMLAIEAEHPEALAEHLARLQEAVTAGIVPKGVLRELLACRGADSQPGLSVMLADERPHACMAAWRAAVAQAHGKGLLTHRDVMALTSCHDAQGVPLLHHLIRTWFPENRSWLWLALVKELFHAGALAQPTRVLEAMETRAPAGPAPLISRLMADTSDITAVWVLIKLYREAFREQMIDASELTHLLLGVSKDGLQASALISALRQRRDGQVEIYLNGLISLAQDGLLDADHLCRLFDGNGLGPLSPLGTALTDQWADGVELLLKASLKAAQQKLITADQWCGLLRSTPASRTWTPLRDCRSERIQAIVGVALGRAGTLGLVGSAEGSALMQAWEQRRA